MQSNKQLLKIAFNKKFSTTKELTGNCNKSCNLRSLDIPDFFLNKLLPAANLGAVVFTCYAQKQKKTRTIQKFQQQQH
jgi:hypothetical protein